MKSLLITIGLVAFMTGSNTSLSVFDFSSSNEISSWIVVNDGVMGGLSQARFYKSDAGNGVFEGNVSLENNGGFSSVRHRFSKKDVREFSKVKLRLKGDGKRFQFRVKTDSYDRHSYISYFQTNGEWQEVIFSLNDLYPVFRGRQLRMANYPGESMEEIAFLIGNKKAENFRLEIDSIELYN